GRAPEPSGEGGDAHREEHVARPGLRPAYRRQPVLTRPPLDLRHAGPTLVSLRPGAAAEALEETTKQDRLPDRRLGKHGVNALRGKVRVRGAEVEVEDRAVHLVVGVHVRYQAHFARNAGAA